MEVGKRIELYGDTVGAVEYVQHMGTDLTIVNSARVSFGKQKDELEENDKKLINYLVKHRHTSTFEHNLVTFRFTVPLFVRSQHHRHRTWSYNEISRRYTSLDLRFYEPDYYRFQHSSNRQASELDSRVNPVLNIDGKGKHLSRAVKDHNLQSLKLYETMIENGVCREQARGILPQNLYTEYYGTTNLNNLMKFVGLRTHEGAQLEIQKVAEACLDIASELWPVAVESYRKNRQ